MNMILTNKIKEADGIFGILESEDGDFSCVTLQHAYDSGNGNGTYEPKLPTGTYTCQRSQHQLLGMAQPFETFQIMNVPGHTNVLIHMGNYNRDSDGCVLVGRRIVPNPDGSGVNMISSSLNTFNALMDFQKGNDQFSLIVKDM